MRTRSSGTGVVIALLAACRRRLIQEAATVLGFQQLVSEAVDVLWWVDQSTARTTKEEACDSSTFIVDVGRDGGHVDKYEFGICWDQGKHTGIANAYSI